MAVYQVETENGVYEVETEGTQPMFSSETEGRQATAKAIGQEAMLQKQADRPFQTAINKTIVDFPAFANKAINTATLNIPEIIANRFGATLNPTEEQALENPIAMGIAEGIGFTAPTGAPMKAIESLNVIKNPLTRAISQGSGAMATQIPVGKETLPDYAGKIAAGGAFGVAGRGVEKVAEGAIQAGAKATSGRIHDYLLKLPVGAFKFGKNPVKVAADEGIVAGNMAEYEQLAAQRLKERSAQLEGAIQDSNKTVNVSEMVDKHLNEASRKLTGSLKDRTSKIEELNTVKQNLEAQYGDLTQLRVQDAIKLKRQLADDFPFTQENAGDITTKSAHKIYHDINKFVEEAHPEIAELNERVSGLIDIKNAARNRSAVEMRNNPVGLVGRLAGVGAAGIGIGAGAPVEGLISGLAIMGIEKAVQSPAVLTRVAKALSSMTMDDRAKVFARFPKIKEAVRNIQVDARDIEILPRKSDIAVSTPINRRSAPIDVKGSVFQEKVGTPIGSRKMLENKSVEGQGFKSVRDPNTIRMGSAQGEGVIPMGVKPKVVEAGGTSVPRRMEVIEQGAESVPVSKKIEKTGKKSTPILSKEKVIPAASAVVGGSLIASSADAKELKADKHGYYNYNLSPKESIYKDGDEIKSTEASTYGWGEKLSDKRFDGKKFNADESFVAMRGIPMGSIVEVTDKKTGKKIQVEVLDGGPHRRLDRKVDLSKGAWKKLGYNKAGITDVSVKVIKLGQGRVFAQKKAIQKNKEK